MRMLSRFKMLGMVALLAAFMGVTMVGCGGDGDTNPKDAPKVDPGRKASDMDENSGPVAPPPSG